MTKFRGRLIAALDIGTTKVVCFIARVRSEGELEVIGIGHQVSQGVNAGTITQIKAVEACVLAAVNAAEQMAGANIDQVVVNISGSRLVSQTANVGIAMNGNEVTDKTVSHLVGMAVEQSMQKDRAIIHCIPYEYHLDDGQWLKDPQGMYGSQLHAKLHVVSVSSTAIMNITHCLAHCQMDVQDFIASAYASSIACLSRDEKELGAIVLDMGGGTTSIAVFKRGNMVYTDTIPLGGIHVTRDIAHGLSTDIANAERVKTLHGSVLGAAADVEEMIEVPQIGEEDEGNLVSRAFLVHIIRPRVEEIFELAHEKLKNSGMENISGKIILTGGAAQLLGVKELAAQVFKKQVRIVPPYMMEGLAESTRGPAFATAIGMLKYTAEKAQKEKFIHEKGRYTAHGGYMMRAFAWLRENF